MQYPHYVPKPYCNKYNKSYPKNGVSDGATDRASSVTDPNVMNPTRSCGSFSDPGDSYGGREYNDGTIA